MTLRYFSLLHIFWQKRVDEIIMRIIAKTSTNRWLNRYVQWRACPTPRGQRIKNACESMGPLFVKFGQMLSTRRDLLPEDIANELESLQEQVPPANQEQIMALLHNAYDGALHQHFATFDDQPIACASVAQVYFATLQDGTEVAVKVLRPGIRYIIKKDIEALNLLAFFIELLWPSAQRLKPRAVVAEFKKNLYAELNMMREAASCSLLKKNFAASNLLLVPEVYWDYCRPEVLVMERMVGTPINRIDQLDAQQHDRAKLARMGVEIFFTQVFKDGFFHGDMHPGNIRVAADGRYIALDFGIMGALSEYDKYYLAHNFLAFFKRDYRRVAQLHIDSGWVPKHTPVEEFETIIRSVCEPIFAKPLNEISFGTLLVQLFNVGQQFSIEIQPQLILLQKTLLNIEGLGRQLYPQLNLWDTAQPLLEEWLNRQIGWQALWQTLQGEAATWPQSLPKIPRLVERALTRLATPNDSAIQAAIQQQNRWLKILSAVGGVLCVLVGYLLITLIES